MSFDCAGAAFSKVRASARVELFDDFWVPKVMLLGSFWEVVLEVQISKNRENYALGASREGKWGSNTGV